MERHSAIPPDETLHTNIIICLSTMSSYSSCAVPATYPHR